MTQLLYYLLLSELKFTDVSNSQVMFSYTSGGGKLNGELNAVGYRYLNSHLLEIKLCCNDLF